jgi:hypothetical protein
VENDSYFVKISLNFPHVCGELLTNSPHPPCLQSKKLQSLTQYPTQHIHTRQDASRLNGAYGNAEGVSILPESRTTDATVEVLPSTTKASRDDLGADSNF